MSGSEGWSSDEDDINEDEHEYVSSNEDSSDINEDDIDEDDWPATLGKCFTVAFFDSEN